MTSHWLFQLVVLAVLLAWVVGAYNRLARLRAAIVSAWEQIVAALVKRSEAMAAVADAVREPLASEAATLRALIELQPTLMHDAVHGPQLAAGLAAWREAEPRILFARQGFDDAVDVYNKAIHQWPTRLIASPLGFRSAGRV